MAKTILNQECTTYESSGAVYFKIASTVGYVAEGDLPHADIFLHQVTVPADPKSDVFLRIATLADLSAVPRGREATLAAGETAYLSSGFIVEYDDITTAVQAKNLIQARVDQLISDWHTYQHQYRNPSFAEFPLTESSVLAAAKESLKTTIRTRDAREDALASAQREYEIASVTASSAATAVTDAQARYDTVAALSARFSSVVFGYTAFRTAMQTYVAAGRRFLAAAQTHASAYPQDTAFATQVSLFQVDISDATTAATQEAVSVNAQMDPLAAEFPALVTSYNATLQTARNAKRAADAAVAAAKTKVTLAEASLTAAQAAVDEALIVVRNYDPRFDVASV